MGKVSRAAAEQHREEIVATSSEMFRERGIQAVTISDIMSRVGLTHGGFYRHFESKQDLVVTAISHSLGLVDELLDQIESEPVDHDGLVHGYFAYYLSDEHQAGVDKGCPSASLAIEIAREPDGSPVKEAYSVGLRKNVEKLASGGYPDGHTATQEDIDRALVDFAQALGATIIARATSGSEIAAHMIRASRAELGVD
jgi:TetR/AcrR family transcriptional regulator, transcriptional repressor for nem operon